MAWIAWQLLNQLVRQNVIYEQLVIEWVLRLKVDERDQVYYWLLVGLFLDFELHFPVLFILFWMVVIFTLFLRYIQILLFGLIKLIFSYFFKTQWLKCLCRFKNLNLLTTFNNGHLPLALEYLFHLLLTFPYKDVWSLDNSILEVNFTICQYLGIWLVANNKDECWMSVALLVE